MNMHHRTAGSTVLQRARPHTLVGLALTAGLLSATLPISAQAAEQARDLAVADAAPLEPTALTQHGGRIDQELGTVLNSHVCDVDADGNADVTARGAVALGGPSFADMAAQRRLAGHQDQLADLPQWTPWSTDGPGGFTCAGDVNGDGKDDFVEVPTSSARVVAVEHSLGSRNTSGQLEQQRVRRYVFPTGTRDLGARALGRAGDLDGDGADEVLISQHGANTTGRAENGRLWVLRGQLGPSIPAAVSQMTLTSSGNTADLALVLDGPMSGDRLGSAVGLGDVTGDGIGDIAVASETGTVWLIAGKRSASVREIDLDQLDATDGRVWARGAHGLTDLAAGDVNGDGRTDLVLGLGAAAGGTGAVAALTWAPASGEGPATVDLATGSVSATGTAAGFVVRAERTGDSLGTAVAVIGDIDGDGAHELLLGAPGHDPLDPDTGQRVPDSGAVYVVAGRAGHTALDLSGLNPASGHRIDGVRGRAQDADQTSRFGADVAALGDVDGNGALDYAVAAPGHSDRAAHRQGAVTVALNGALAATVEVKVARRIGDDGVAVTEGTVLRASDVLDARVLLATSTRQGAVGDVVLAAGAQQIARSRTTLEAPHRGVARINEFRLTRVGEQRLVASAPGVLGRRDAAEGQGPLVLVTDGTTTSVTAVDDALHAQVSTTTAGAPVDGGTVTFASASGEVLAADVAVVGGGATTARLAERDLSGAVATYTGISATFAGAERTVLDGSQGSVASTTPAPDAGTPAAVSASVKLSRATARHGRAVTAALTLSRPVTGEAEVVIAGTVRATAPLTGRGISVTLPLPTTLKVGAHAVQVRVVEAGRTTTSNRTVLRITRIVSGRIRATVAPFRPGQRPTMTVRVGTSADGARAVGTVRVAVAGKIHRVALTSARKGKVKVTLPHRRTSTRAKVAFVPRSTATRATPRAVKVSVAPRR